MWSFVVPARTWKWWSLTVTVTMAPGWVSDSQPLPGHHHDAVLGHSSVQALRPRRWRWWQGRRCTANLGELAQVGGVQWMRRRLDQVVLGEGMDEPAIDPQCHPGSCGVRSERELVAEKATVPSRVAGAVDLLRDPAGSGCQWDRMRVARGPAGSCTSLGQPVEIGGRQPGHGRLGDVIVEFDVGAGGSADSVTVRPAYFIRPIFAVHQ